MSPLVSSAQLTAAISSTDQHADSSFVCQVSALLGRIPSAVGYQPTLSTDLGGLQERITTTSKGSITSVQVHVMTDSNLLPDHGQAHDCMAAAVNSNSGF